MKNYALILAAGSGSRFGEECPKQFVQIGNKTIIETCIEAFEQNSSIDAIIVVTNTSYQKETKELLSKFKKVSSIITGGKTRKESSYLGICEIHNLAQTDNCNVLIHDCARPFVSQDLINRCIKALETNIAVSPAISVTDTIIEIENNYIKSIPSRATLKKNQTPQCFRLDLIKKAHELANNNKEFTDDCSLILESNLAQIYIIDGEEKNIKITYKSDI